MPIPVGQYSQQGLRITVNSLIKDPLIIPQRMLDLTRNQFMMESLLRQVPGAEAGVIGYSESAPLFADEDPSIVAEGGEIPLITGSDGIPKAAFTVKMGAGIEITREMRTRNRVDQVDRRMKQIKNTFVRVWERRMFAALLGASTLTMAASAAWGTASTNIRSDVLTALRLVREASVSGASPGPLVDDYLGFEPDTLVMSTRTEAKFFNNTSVIDIYKNSPAVKESPTFTGTLPKEFMGLTVMTSRFMADDIVWVLQRKECGGYSDEYPLETTPLYADQPRQVWRADTTRRTAIFIDQPKAVCKITGI